MINSLPSKISHSNPSSLSHSMITPQLQLQIQHLNLNLQKKSSHHASIKHSTKQHSSTDRTHTQNQTIKDFIQGIQESNKISDLHNNQKEDLLQKRKQYAESIRKKNRCSLKQQKSNNKKSLNNQTLNVSLSFTPPKDFTNNNYQNHCKITNSNRNDRLEHYSEIQNEYYSLKKFGNLEQLPNTKVFGQTNINHSNSTFNKDNQNDKNLPNGECFKVSTIAKNASVDLGNSFREGNHSERRNTNNKENKPHTVHPESARKNTCQKYTSYAQIFDKKSSMNTLITSQKSKGAGNTASRQMSSKKKDKSALKSMATPEEQLNYDFNSHQFSTQLDTFVNSFALEDFAEGIENFSRINFCESEMRKETFVIKTENIEKEQVSQSSNEQVVHLKQTNKNSLQIISQTICHTIDLTEEYERIRKQDDRQIMTLAKQNATFKRELATFRKQNSTLRKELQNSKGTFCDNFLEYIEELQKKAKTLLDQQNQFISNQENFISEQAKNYVKSGSQTTQTLKEQSNLSICLNKKTLCFSLPADNNLQQILISTEKQLFSLKSTNKALQLKVYMLQKKLTHEEQLNKKRLAMQVYNWRDKYNKLRNQNIKLKNSYMNPFLNSDLSISMEISRDQ